jgi:hypothetical protein
MNPPVVAVRKQVYELALHDLSLFPVWEFRVDEKDEAGQDESTVRPYIAAGPLDPADRMFVVRTAFTLADGSRMHGYLTPPVRGDDGPGTLQPVIVTSRGQVRLWCGTAEADTRRLARSYDLLGKEAARVVGGPVRGIVPGFLVLEDFQTRKARTVV